jgi:signal transduction histidine kinase
VAALLLAASLANIPFYPHPLPRTPAFIAVIDTALILSDVLAAALLFAQFTVQRSWALLSLASGYLFTGLIMIPHLLTFPGVFSERGLLGAGFNTTVWLYFFWHFGLPLAVIAYAILKNSERQNIAPARTGRAIGASVTGVAAFVVGLTLLTTAGHSLVPAMMSNAIQWSPRPFRIVSFLVFLVLITAMAMVWRNRRSVLDLWLLVSLWAWLIELVMVTITTTRYSLLWFTGRLYGLLAGIFVLLMLLWETNRIYGRLALSALKQRQERESRFATMEALSAAIDHEVRQPLGAVVANANAGRRWLVRAQPDMAEARLAFEAISADGHRAAEFIRSVRAIFTRREQTMVAVDLNNLARDTIALIGDELQSTHVRIELDLVSVPPIAVDPGQMQQVLLNLIRNAADAMQGMVDREAMLRVSSRPDNGTGMELVVADNGPGIPPEIVDRIFDPFFTTKKKGMGMGLAICRSIIEEHGGRLDVVPAKPHGAQFRILLQGADA